MKFKSLEEQIAYLEKENESLRSQLDAIRRLVFGKRSERFVKEDPNQLKLDFQQGEPVRQVVEDVRKVIPAKKSKPAEPKKQPVRQPISPELPRQTEVVEPENIPTGAKQIGEEVTEILEYRPAQVYVRRIVRPKYVTPDGVIMIADLPSLPLPKSNAGASMISAILTQKYVDHLPIYRQMEQFKRDGFEVASSTIHHWVESGIEKLRPLHELMMTKLRQSDYIQVDETRMPVLKSDKPGAAVKGYMWAFTDPKTGLTAFHWDGGSRAQRVLVDVLDKFQGALQSDGYGAYDIYENAKGVTLLGCWAHARRKFYEAQDENPLLAEQALIMIGSLYEVEREADELGLPPDKRQLLREQKSFPVIRNFQQWMLDVYPKVLPKSKLGRAILYASGIYPRLARYIMDGNYKIDNNGIENAIRPVAIGRKNYLYCGNDASAERTAIIYSIFSTCKKCGVNPHDYLSDILSRIDETKISKLEELLPQNWKK